jgi:hypothetical protein
MTEKIAAFNAIAGIILTAIMSLFPLFGELVTKNTGIGLSPLTLIREV